MLTINQSRSPANRTEVEARIASHPIEGSVAQRRSAFEALAPLGPQAELCALNGVPVEVHNPGAGRSILYLHGGGYMFGSARSHAGGAALLARLTGRRVVVPEYRLTPEHRWPAQLEDAVSVLAGLETATPVVGISAGGHLAINLALQQPRAVSHLALISPNTDRSGQSSTRSRNSTADLMNDHATDRALSDECLGHLPDDHPHASPLLADLSGLPPLWMTAASNEVLLDDTLLFAAAAARSGVPVQTDILPGLFHMWALWPDLPEAQQTWKRIARLMG